MLGYWVNQRASHMLDLHEYLERLPPWVKRFPVGSPAFLIAVRVIPGFGGTVATATRRGVSGADVGARLDDVRDRGSDLHAAGDLRRPRDRFRAQRIESIADQHWCETHRCPHFHVTAKNRKERDAVTTLRSSTTPESLDALCARVDASTRVALDTEFHTERTYAPRLMVVQLAFDDGVAIVDPLARAGSAPACWTRLRETTVVGHALSSDLKIFADRFDMLPPNVFDTQIAAAFLGYGMQISLADLVRDLRGVRLAKSQTVSDWASRPLSERQIDYLVDDVAHLLPMHDDAGRAAAKTTGRLEWALEEVRRAGRHRPLSHATNAARICAFPGAMRMNRRELGDSERAREACATGIARERDMPLKYVIPDDVIAGLATSAAQDASRIWRSCAGSMPACAGNLGAGDRRGGRARRSASPKTTLPEKPQRPLGPARDTLASRDGRRRRRDRPAERTARRACSCRARRSSGSRARCRATAKRFEAALGAVARGAYELVGEPLWRLLSGQAGLDDRRLRATAIPKYVCPMTTQPNSFNARDTLRVGDRSYTYFRLDALERAGLRSSRDCRIR